MRSAGGNCSIEPSFRKPIMSDTIFSKIVRREIPADIVYEDDEVLAFRDLNPQAPVHVLFIPKRPLATLNDATAGDAELLGKLLLATAAYAKREGFAEQGYRTVINTNEDGGQTVFHLHVHLLAGRRMHWPPG
jgi:histidine triad (HIT) family protein